MSRGPRSIVAGDRRPTIRVSPPPQPTPVLAAKAGEVANLSMSAVASGQVGIAGSPMNGQALVVALAVLDCLRALDRGGRSRACWTGPRPSGSWPYSGLGSRGTRAHPDRVDRAVPRHRELSRAAMGTPKAIFRLRRCSGAKGPTSGSTDAHVAGGDTRPTH